MDKIKTSNSIQTYFFYCFSFLVLGSLFTAVYLESPLPLLIPIISLVGFVGALNLNRLYAFFFLLLPFSIEVNLVGGLGTDLPAEPFMIGLTLIALFLFANNFGKIDARYLKNPISFLLILHLVWIAISTFYSQDILVSTKYLLAKIWYVVPFYFLALYLLRSEQDFRVLIKCLIASLSLAICFVILSHAFDGFSFDRINQAVSPIFRNHVNYACMLTLCVPYIWYLIVSSEHKFAKTIYSGAMLLFLLAIYLSYTRAAYVAIAIGIGAYFIIRWRLVKIVVLFVTILALGAISFLAIDDHYLDFQPEFEKAITHAKFDDLLEATTKLEDISTVERFYRWVAGGYMVADRPLVGFGPATFYFFYSSYTVTGFQTYVSDNPEKSGIHNYYLMTAVEQGLIGCLIFVCFCFMVMIKGEEAYHDQTEKNKKAVVMSAILSFIIICTILLINDMIEAAKVGPFFFLAPALIMIYGLHSKESRLTK